MVHGTRGPLGCPCTPMPKLPWKRLQASRFIVVKRRYGKLLPTQLGSIRRDLYRLRIRATDVKHGNQDYIHISLFFFPLLEHTGHP